MMAYYQHFPVIAVMGCFLCAFLVEIFGSHNKVIRNTLSIGMSAVALALMILLIKPVMIDGEIISYWLGNWEPVNGIAIGIGFDSVSPTYQMIKALAKAVNNDIKFQPENTMMISPDEGGMGRCVYYSHVLGINLGMFYKRRDYSKVVNGRSPIIAHEFLGSDVEGKAVIVADDMIASGDSMIDVCRQLKALKARRIFVFATFGLFSSGVERFDEAYAEGYFDKIFTTNLIYTPDKLFQREWYYSVDLSKYVALIINALNHDETVSPYLNPMKKIQSYLQRFHLK